MTDTPYAIAIFVSRESGERAMRTIIAALDASLPGTVVDVLVNGNPALVDRLRQLCPEVRVPEGKLLRLWHIALGDKANAWNQFVHSISGEQEIVWFMDGYVTPNRDAFMSMRRGLEQHREALAATGVPTDGLSAGSQRSRMQEKGGLQGNFFCIRGAVVRRIAAEGMRLPLGLYWVDGLVGALLNFNLDPSRHDWDPRRVLIDHAATWKLESPGLLRPGDLANRLRRLVRQTRGRIENHAYRQFLHVKKRNPKTLPLTVHDLVSNWVAEQPGQAARAILLRPWRLFAYRQLAGPRDWSGQAHAAELVLEHQGP
jgi:hypothetical protein